MHDFCNVQCIGWAIKKDIIKDERVLVVNVSNLPMLHIDRVPSEKVPKRAQQFIALPNALSLASLYGPMGRTAICMNKPINTLLY